MDVILMNKSLGFHGFFFKFRSSFILMLGHEHIDLHFTEVLGFNRFS